MITIDQSSIEQFRSHMSAKGRQPATVDSYSRDCEAFLTFLQDQGVHGGDIGPGTMQEFQQHLKSRGSRDNSIRRSVIGVRQFFRYLQDTHHWDRSPFDDAPIPERDDSFKHRLTARDMDTLLACARATHPHIKGVRDVVMLTLLGYEGLKVHELIQLEWRDFLRASDGGRLVIRGERNRTITLEAATTEAISQLRDIVQTGDNPKLMQSHSKMMLGFKGSDAKYMVAGLTRHGVKFALYELGTSAGLNHTNSEELRHHAMSHKVSLGFTPELLMNHLGLRTIGKIGRHFNTDHLAPLAPS